MAILVMVAAVVATGIPAAEEAYVSSVDKSNAQLLLSDTITRLRDVLSAANPDEEIQDTNAGGDAYVQFTSYETGLLTSIVEGDGTSSDSGFKLVEQSPNTEATINPRETSLVPAKSASGLYASNLTTEFDSENGGGIFYDPLSSKFTVKGLQVYRTESNGNRIKLDSYDGEIKISILAR